MVIIIDKINNVVDFRGDDRISGATWPRVARSDPKECIALLRITDDQSECHREGISDVDFLPLSLLRHNNHHHCRLWQHKSTDELWTHLCDILFHSRFANEWNSVLAIWTYLLEVGEWIKRRFKAGWSIILHHFSLIMCTIASKSTRTRSSWCWWSSGWFSSFRASCSLYCCRDWSSLTLKNGIMEFRYITPSSRWPQSDSATMQPLLRKTLSVPSTNGITFTRHLSSFGLFWDWATWSCVHSIWLGMEGQYSLFTI